MIGTHSTCSKQEPIDVLENELLSKKEGPKPHSRKGLVVWGWTSETGFRIAASTDTLQLLYVRMWFRYVPVTSHLANGTSISCQLLRFRPGNTFVRSTDTHPAFHHPVASANTNPPDRLAEIATCKTFLLTENTLGSKSPKLLVYEGSLLQASNEDAPDSFSNRWQAWETQGTLVQELAATSNHKEGVWF